MKKERVKVPPVDLNSRFYVPENVLFRKLEDESILLNLDSEMYYGLDEVGTRMWVAVETSESLDAAYTQLLTEYDVDSEQLLTDLVELVRDLLDQNLISFS